MTHAVQAGAPTRLVGSFSTTALSASSVTLPPSVFISLRVAAVAIFSMTVLACIDIDQVSLEMPPPTALAVMVFTGLSLRCSNDASAETLLVMPIPPPFLAAFLS
jgi:hypothetical protein